MMTAVNTRRESSQNLKLLLNLTCGGQIMDIDKELLKVVKDHCGFMLLDYAEILAKEEIPTEQEKKEQFIFSAIISTVACLLGSDLIILKKKESK